jgi:hypothetical protein
MPSAFARHYQRHSKAEGAQRCDAQGVKTARFSKVVEKCGEPETYLLLMDPAKDRTFKRA